MIPSQIRRNLPVQVEATYGVARGIVRLVEYQGREYDVEIALESGAVLEARLPTAPKVGAAVGLAVEPGRIVLLPPEEGA